MIVADDTSVVERVSRVLDGLCDVASGRTVDDILTGLQCDSYDAVILGTGVAGSSGLTALEAIKRSHPHMPVLVAATDANDDVEDMLRRGAYDYIAEPFDHMRLLHTIRRATEFDALCNANRRLKDRLVVTRWGPELVGNSLLMNHVRDKIDLLGRTGSPVLITGEPGTGRRTVAGCVHHASSRASAPFVVFNCAATPPAIGASELFGSNGGGGRLAEARGGTIVFDEIGNLDSSLQTMLAEEIANGGDVRHEVRVIATTSRNLREDVRSGRFREDLYYCINMVPLDLPPLRERREDIPLLIAHFIEFFVNRDDRDPVHLSDAAAEKLERAGWRGNVRELQNVIERAIVLAAGRVLEPGYFRFESERDDQLSRVEEAFRFGSVRDMEKLMILNRLKENEQNRTRSARTLEISVRTLRNKLHEYNVPPRNRYTELVSVVEP